MRGTKTSNAGNLLNEQTESSSVGSGFLYQRLHLCHVYTSYEWPGTANQMANISKVEAMENSAWKNS